LPGFVQMPKRMKQPKTNPGKEPGLSDLSKSDFEALLESLEDSQVLEDRKLFLQAPGTLSMSVQPKPDVNCLPPFYRHLVRRKDAFPDERDYYASIKAMRQIHKKFAFLLKPYFVASMVATKRPGHMHEFAATLEKDLGELHTVDPEDLPLLLHRQNHTPPLSLEPDFLELIPTMRNWSGERFPLRTLLLLGHLFRIGGHTPFAEWLENPNLVLGGDSPMEHLAKGHWVEVGDLAEKLLAGGPAASERQADKKQPS
jgi:hypothetical protein